MDITGIFEEFYFHLLFTGGRMRYRGSSSNNPNLMYRNECDRRMRPGGNSSKDGRDSRNNRDEDQPSSSYRDQSQDHRNSYASGSDQYQSYSSASGGYGGGGGQDQPRQVHSQFSQALLPPLSGGLQPLMAQQFAAQQPPLMGFVGQTPYPFAAPPPPPPPPGLPAPRN